MQQAPAHVTTRILEHREAVKHVVQAADRTLSVAEVRKRAWRQNPSLSQILLATAVADLRQARAIRVAD